MKMVMILAIIIVTIFVVLFCFFVYFNKNLLFALKISVGDEIIQYVEEPKGKVVYLYGRPYCHVKVRVKPEDEYTVIELLKKEYIAGKKIIPQYSNFEYIPELNKTELTYVFCKQKSGKFIRCKEVVIYVTRNSDGYMYLYIDGDLFFNTSI